MIDYPRQSYYWRQHATRFQHFVEGLKLTCMECGGRGGEVVSIYEGQGPFEQCGWCLGTGYMSPYGRNLWLRQKKMMKARRSLWVVQGRR